MWITRVSVGASWSCGRWWHQRGSYPHDLPGNKPEQDRDGSVWVALTGFIFSGEREPLPKGRYVKNGHLWEMSCSHAPLVAVCTSHLNNEFRGDAILHMAKVQAMNRALLCSNKCWGNVCLSQCCWMENEIVDFWATLPEMCKAAKIQNLFGNPQPSITQAIVK